jgi:predicted O-methyltransferase YrrM
MASHEYLLVDKTVDPAWRKVDDYLEPLLCPTGTGSSTQEADAFQRTLESHGKEGIPAINVSPLQGMYLYNTALSIGLARGSIRILEVGTLAGCKLITIDSRLVYLIILVYTDSTLWLAKAAKQVGSDSKVISLEYSDKHAKVARRNIASAGFREELVQVITGDARKTINDLLEQGEKYDLFFIDADKTSECLCLC